MGHGFLRKDQYCSLAQMDIPIFKIHFHSISFLAQPNQHIRYWIWLPSGYVKIAIENGPVKIVDFPINSMVISHSYVNVYQAG